MKTANELHQDMIAYWNGPGGMHWVQEQARVDMMIQPVAAVGSFAGTNRLTCRKTLPRGSLSTKLRSD